MKIKDKKPIIIAALKALGVKIRELEITPDTELIGNVFVNGEFFGVFDYGKRAFVEWGEIYEYRKQICGNTGLRNHRHSKRLCSGRISYGSEPLCGVES